MTSIITVKSPPKRVFVKKADSVLSRLDKKQEDISMATTDVKCRDFIDSVSEPESTPSPPPSPEVVVAVKDKEFQLVKSKKETIVTGRIPKARALWMYEHLMAHPEVRKTIVTEHVSSRTRGETSSDGTDHDSQTYEVLVMRFLASVANNSNSDGTFSMNFKPSVHGYGRRYSNRVNSIQTQGLSRKVRHTLLNGVARDFDGIACFQVIARQLCQKANIPWPSLDNYVDNIDTVIAVARAEGCGKPVVKQQHLRILHNGASKNTKWPTKSISLYARLTQFKSEADIAIPRLVNDTSLGIMVNERIIQKFESKKDIKAKSAEAGSSKSAYTNPHGRNIGLQCQAVEDALLSSWIKTVSRFGGDLRDLCFDGLMADEETWDCSREAEFLKTAEEEAYKATGFRVPIIHKAMDEGFNIPEDELKLCELRVEEAEKSGFSEKLVELDEKWKKVVPGDEVNDKCEAIIQFEASASTFIAKDLTVINKGADMVFENDVSAGRFLCHQFIKECTIIAVKIDIKSPVDIYVHNPSITNRISSSASCLLNLLEGLKGLKLKKALKASPPSHNEWKTILDVIKTSCENYDTSTDIFKTQNKSTLGKCFYKNGYYDFVRGRFVNRVEDPHAVTMIRVERDFWDKDTWDNLSRESPEVKAVWDNIVVPMGVDDIERNGMLRICARAMGGHYTDKHSRETMWLGDRSSSKGTIQSALTSAFGEYPNGYVTTGTAPVITSQGVSDLALINKAIISSGSYIARIEITNEIPNVGGKGESVLDGEAMKSYEGGDTVTGRLLYGSDLKVTPIAFRFMAFNAVPEVKGSVNCLEYTSLFHMPYKYVSQEVIDKCKGLPCLKLSDPNIKEKCQSDKWALAFTWLISRAWKSSVFEASGNEVSDRNKTIRKLEFKELSADKVEGAFSNEYSLFAKVFDMLSQDDIALPSYNPKDWFIPSCQVTEVWARGFSEKGAKDNIGEIVAECKRVVPGSGNDKRDVSNSIKVKKFMSRIGTIKEDKQRFELDGKRYLSTGYFGLKFATMKARVVSETCDV